MAISYEDALATLTSMFGPPWTQETLDTVLRHYQGHMENTVDAVLRHGDGDPQVLITQLHSGKTPEAANTNMDEQLALQLAQEERGRPRAPTRWPQAPTSQPPPAPQPTKKGRGTPTELPPDFLRIPGAETTASSMDSDEALARMLQDELFAQELRNNPEFAHLARGRSRPHMVGGRPSNARSSSGRHVGELPRASSGRTGFPGGGQRTSGGGGHDFMDRISELGDNAKKRLATFAAQWNAENRSGSAAPGTTGGGLQETRGLLDDDDQEMEMTFSGGGAKKHK